MVLKKAVITIQAAGYNGAHTVLGFELLLLGHKFFSLQFTIQFYGFISGLPFILLLLK
jgi:hypothetical protein